MPDSGSYRGDAARRWLNAWVESFDRLTQEPIEFIEAGDQVVVEFIQQGAPVGGVGEVELRSWAVCTFREGILVRTDLFIARDAAFEAAGLNG